MHQKVMLKHTIIFIFISLLISSCDVNRPDGLVSTTENDSIPYFISKAKRTEGENQKQALINAHEIALGFSNDSIKNSKLSEIAYLSLILNRRQIFKTINDDFFNLSSILKDTLKVGEAHWNYGSYYEKIGILDSSYYHYFKGFKSFESVNNKFYTGKMLYNLAYIETKYKDYLSAETKLFKAIKNYEVVNKPYSIFKCYYLLAEIYSDIEDYENFNKYLDEAKKYLSDFKKIQPKISKYNFISLKNFSGTVKFDRQKYQEAISYFREALREPDLEQNQPQLYNLIRLNLAKTRLAQSDTSGIKRELQKFFKFRNNLKDQDGIIQVYYEMSNYEALAGDTLKAIDFSQKAKNIANQFNFKKQVLQSLLKLAKYDIANASIHYEEYLDLKDAIEMDQRKFRNKFAAIQYETNTYIDKAEQLSNKNLILMGLMIIFMILTVLTYSIITQKSKTKTLLLEKEQQMANEKIYQLMLTEQKNLEQARIKERNRISEELHDGILGKIFGTRMKLGFLDFSNEVDSKEKFNLYIDDLQTIENDIRKVSHDLKNNHLGKSNFIHLVENLIKEKSQIGDFEFNLTKNDTLSWEDISDVYKLHIYRIVQELLQNILKHASAFKVNIVFSATKDSLQLIVQDDGIGFESHKNFQGIGLKNLASRLEKINGKYTVDSKKGLGTKFKISIPKQ